MPENRIRELRDEHGMSQAALAGHMEVDGSTVSRWERGKQPIPDVAKVRIAELFGVSVPWLMGWTDGPENGNGERTPVAA
jgi:transcriptional regulator with XRE-family HTH domain